MIAPPPRPCRIRKMTSDRRSQASAHSTLATVNRKIELV